MLIQWSVEYVLRSESYMCIGKTCFNPSLVKVNPPMTDVRIPAMANVAGVYDQGISGVSYY